MKLVQPEGQDRNVFNNFKRFISNLPKLTPEQLAIVNFEIVHEARMRGAKESDE